MRNVKEDLKMAKNQAALTSSIGGTAARKGIIKTGPQNNDAMASPDTKSSNKTPNLTARKQTRMAE